MRAWQPSSNVPARGSAALPPDPLRMRRVHGTIRAARSRASRDLPPEIDTMGNRDRQKKEPKKPKQPKKPKT